MSACALLEKAKEILSPTTVKYDEFVKKLAAHFALASPDSITDDMLVDVTWEDLEDSCKVPLGLAKMIRKAWRPDGEDTPQPVAAPTSPQAVQVTINDADPEKAAKSMSPKELIAKADLTKKSCPYAKRLNAADMANGRRFVVRGPNDKVDQDKTLELFEQLDDFGEQDSVEIDVDGVLDTFPVLYIGDKPDRTADEHPLYENRPIPPTNAWSKMRRDPENGATYLECQQLLRVAVGTKELDPEEYHEVDLQVDVTDRGLPHLRKRYPKAALKLKDLKKVSQEPKLRCPLKQRKARAGAVRDAAGNPVGNDPFNTGRNRRT